MSMSYPVQLIEESLQSSQFLSVRYLATIQGCPLLWDAQTHQPWWPDGEPMDITYEPDGGITMEALCDVNRVMSGVQPKRMDCGHTVRSGEAYLTWLEEQRDTCLTCAQEGKR